MSVHRGAQILLGSAAGGTTLNSVPISNPNQPQTPPNAALQTIISTAGAGDPIASAYTVSVAFGTSSGTTYTAAETNSGRYFAVDSSNNMISYPT